jgi:hypothetical protein
MLTKQQHELERQSDVVTTRVNVGDLKTGYSMFGNKGNVWNDECHISKSDFSGRTLCRVPMLSSNWGRIENIQTIGCPECIKQYKIDTIIDKF